jgi:nitroimidazol reductase NimA-like FMN-containing flavoprotein (pyridoxamine 5'-phosphate oxidase superfamily)
MRPGQLRRKEREMDRAGCVKCLLECEVGHVGTVGSDGTPYVTPMHYAYEPGSKRIYMHISPVKGHLLANLEHSPRVCFEASQVGPLVVKTPEACKAYQTYQSVVCFGEMRQVTDVKEKERISWLLIDKYMVRTGLAVKPTLGPVDGILCLEMRINIMTGKKH